MSGAFMGVAQVARLLEQRQASSVELTTEFVRRAQAHTKLGAFLHLDSDLALAQAQAADKRRSAAGTAPGPNLLGVPIAHKDINVTEDPPTTAGSKKLHR